MVAPKLRFKEFDGDWFSKKIIELADYVDYRGKTPKKVESGVLLVTAKNIKQGYLDYSTSQEFIEPSDFEDVMRRGKVELNDVLITTEAPLGNIASVDRVDIALAQRVIKYRGKPHLLDNLFLKQKFLSESFQEVLQSKATGGTVQGIKGSVLHQISLIVPFKEEQTQIATFLSSVDEKIAQLTQKQQLLSQYKQGMMQKLFSQQIRFKADDGSDFGEWEEIQLNKVASRVTRKNKEDNQNALTISAQMGLVNQQEYFSKQIASRDLTKYYLLHQGEFAYNKSYSAGYPMGAIKRLKLYDKGVVSTLYICFALNNQLHAEFFEHYVESGALVSELEKIAQEGARNHGLLNINLQEFFEIALLKPCLEEQTKIANFLSAIDQKIEVVTQQIEQAKTWKKGLLQQMFV